MNLPAKTSDDPRYWRLWYDPVTRMWRYCDLPERMWLKTRAFGFTYSNPGALRRHIRRLS